MFGTVIEKGNTVAEIKLKASPKKERDLLTRSSGPELIESSDFELVESNFDPCSRQAPDP